MEWYDRLGEEHSNLVDIFEATVPDAVRAIEISSKVNKPLYVLIRFVSDINIFNANVSWISSHFISASLRLYVTTFNNIRCYFRTKLHVNVFFLSFCYVTQCMIRISIVYASRGLQVVESNLEQPINLLLGFKERLQACKLYVMG